MKAINTGEIFDIYGDSLKVYDKLPAQTYIVRFSPNRGFFLEKQSDILISEEKIYGSHLQKVDKVMNTFVSYERSLGIILSGKKGIGKSLFAKLLSIEVIKRDMPLIIVDSYIPGIDSYINSIEQEVMVLFDEFEKTFPNRKNDSEHVSPQESLLSLFDGISAGKKLFVITCNEVTGLNEYLVNRPGRFHYHFRFEKPTDDEVREYLRDKLDQRYYNEIENIVVFANKVELNYDCLRAIAFEINSGICFKDAILDLNIINISKRLFNVFLVLKNNKVLKVKNEYLDMFSEEETICFYTDTGDYLLDVSFNPMTSMLAPDKTTLIIDAENLAITDRADEEDKELMEYICHGGIDHIRIVPCQDRTLHFKV